jgi:poly(3-hydroxyalkanoate) synthetase
VKYLPYPTCVPILTKPSFWGLPQDLAVTASTLRAKHTSDKLHILVAKRNSGNYTYDGIELGGERVCQEIEEEISTLKAQGHEIKKLSLVGYSLGGLVARYAVGLLNSKGVFDTITPVVSPPHLFTTKTNI